MVKIEPLNLPTSTASSQTLSQHGFARGVITVVNESNIPNDALSELNNGMLVEDGAASTRWGTDWYGTAPTAGHAIDGGGLHETSAGAIHLWAVSNGTFYRSINDGATWTACTGATFTVSKKCDSKQIGGYTYVVNGTDVIARYDGTTTLQTYTAVTNPSTAITGVATGMAGAGVNYYYTFSDVNGIGFTTKSTLSSAIAVTKDRSRWDASNFITLTLPAAGAGATRRDIFVTTSTAEDPVYIASVPAATTSYVDNGSAPMIITVTAPTDNTTTGPIASKISLIGNRIWLTGTADDKIWWSGSGAYLGFFSTSYDGSWVILQKGSQFHPVDAEDYRDGKGTPFATVWRRSADGLGDVWQISLDTQTVGDVSFTVPNAYKLPGSRGTNAPFGIVNVLNDYIYPNSQAMYNLGSRAQYLNLLSTDEVSSNIRPTLRTINQAASSKMAGTYFDGKLFMSYPTGASTTNDTTMIYDTEKKQKPWIPKAFTIGFERFFPYTDSLGQRHLLAWKTGDEKFTELAQGILGDYGAAFETVLTTGLQSVNPKNRFDWMQVEEAEVEFSNPTSKMQIELAGTDRSKGYRTQKSVLLDASTIVDIGYDTITYDSVAYDAQTAQSLGFSETSVKRYFRVGKELNNYQFHIVTNTKNASFITRTLQINGTPTKGNKPRQWKLT